MHGHYSRLVCKKESKPLDNPGDRLGEIRCSDQVRIETSLLIHPNNKPANTLESR